MEKARQALDEGDYENAAVLYDTAIEEGTQLQACYRGKGIALMGKWNTKVLRRLLIKLSIRPPS